MLESAGTAVAVAVFLVLFFGGLVVGLRVLLDRFLARARPGRPDLRAAAWRRGGWTLVGVGILALLAPVTDVLVGNSMRPGGVGIVAGAFLLFAIASVLFRRARR